MVRQTEIRIKRSPEKPISKELFTAKRDVERWDVPCRLRGEVLEEPLWVTEEEVEAQLEALGVTLVKFTLKLFCHLADARWPW